MLKVSVAALSPLVVESLAAGLRVRMKVRGRSMAPFIDDGDVVDLAPFTAEAPHVGDILLVRTTSGSFILHRVSRVCGTHFYLRGDAHKYEEGPFTTDGIIAKAESLICDCRVLHLDRGLHRWAGQCWQLALPLRAHLAWPFGCVARIKRLAFRP